MNREIISPHSKTGLDPLEQLRRVKPLEQLIMAKSAILIELEMELANKGLSKTTHSAIESKTAEIKNQIQQISQLMRSIENQLPAPEVEIQKNKADKVEEIGENTPIPKAFKIKPTLVTGAALISIGLASFFSVNYIHSLKTRSPANIVKSSTFEINIAQEFQNQSLTPSKDFLKKIQTEVGKLKGRQARSLSIMVYSRIPSSSEHDEANLKFHKKLTQKRAVAIADALKQLPEYQGLQLIPIGMGANSTLNGKKAIFTLNE